MDIPINIYTVGMSTGYIVLAIAIILIVEIASIKLNFQYAPSTVLNKIADWFKLLFYWIGYVCSIISSYIALIDWLDLFDDIVKALKQLILPIFEMIKSPYQFIKGYMEYAKKWRDYILVVIGSIILIITIITIYCKYF